MRYYTRVESLEREFRFERQGERLVAHADGRTFELDLQPVGDGSLFSLVVDGRSYDVFIEHEQRAIVVGLLGERIRVEVEDERERVAHSLPAAKGGGRCEVRAIMPGIVCDVKVAAGDAVTAGQTLLVLEAMKMQNPMLADAPGRVSKVHAKKGVAVAAGDLLIELEG